MSVTTSPSSSSLFKFAVDDCDVEDDKALGAYRDKRHEWLEWLEGDPRNSINRQIRGMMWDDAAFRALNEARRFSSPEYPTGATAPLLAGLIDQGFVATQILSITRLVDRRQDVISLRRLLDDIEAHAHLITREIFVCHDGLPFDPVEAERAYWEREGPPISGGVIGLPTEGPDAFDISRMAHEAFDKVSATGSGPRSRTDCIESGVFSSLRAALATPDIVAILQLRHKFVAHAADAASRGRAGIERFGVTLNQLEAGQRALVQTAQRIELDLLWGTTRGVVPVPQYDHFIHLDIPVVATDRMGELGEWWRAHCDTREAWTRSPS
ncbi:MAG: hypothetical protein JWQ03_996 [Variovorax sp.]|nr:hypothetical protein [Variovorax sp.]